MGTERALKACGHRDRVGRAGQETRAMRREASTTWGQLWRPDRLSQSKGQRKGQYRRRRAAQGRAGPPWDTKSVPSQVTEAGAGGSAGHAGKWEWSRRRRWSRGGFRVQTREGDPDTALSTYSTRDCDASGLGGHMGLIS